MDPATYGRMVEHGEYPDGGGTITYGFDPGPLGCSIIAYDTANGALMLTDEQHRIAAAELDRFVRELLERVEPSYQPAPCDWPAVLRRWADQPKTETVFGPVSIDHMGAAVERFHAMVTTGRIRLH